MKKRSQAVSVLLAVGVLATGGGAVLASAGGGGGGGSSSNKEYCPPKSPGGGKPKDRLQSLLQSVQSSTNKGNKCGHPKKK